MLDVLLRVMIQSNKSELLTIIDLNSDLEWILLNSNERAELYIEAKMNCNCNWILILNFAGLYTHWIVSHSVNRSARSHLFSSAGNNGFTCTQLIGSRFRKQWNHVPYKRPYYQMMSQTCSFSHFYNSVLI